MTQISEDFETITGIGRRLRRGELSCVEILRSCLDRLDAREPQISAWVLVDRDGALAQAQILDAELKAGRDRGPLHGIPMGVKDIIDVAGFPTGCGSPVQAGLAASADAAIVAHLRSAGAVIMGKTVTTAYAWIDPPLTRNPWHPDRTPGGSSSGSAAAVASGMCLGALGTQTGGSITRPVAFCGVAGMKPTFGKLSTVGIQPFSPSLDHPGPIARFVADLLPLYQAIRNPGSAAEDDALEARPFGKQFPRIGRLGGFFDRRAHPEMRTAILAFMSRSKARGAESEDLGEPVDFEELLAAHRTIMAREAAETHRQRFQSMPEAFPPRITELICEGRRVSPSEHQLALKSKTQWQDAALSLFDDVDALITPAAPGPAPDRSTTGDPAFNSPWSYVGFPTVSIPIGFSADRLPLAVQLIGKPGEDMNLLKIAEWCETMTRSVK
jgi:aspartyl-tRNA(Asn)/glutamyl-tRNA(Gln) amidotransferase subunit A